ncbi:hypothetical protein C8R47DRAFT_667244 [Mycena vitilis]|nr:hypothetical protein C8R47DRAFT_667244 [Mycena vitilis]
MYLFVRGILAGALANLPVFKTPNEVSPAFSTGTVQNVPAAPLHLALAQTSSYAPESATSYSTGDAFNLAILIALFAICLRHTTLGSHIVRYFVVGTTLLLSPSWVPPSFKLLLSSLKAVYETVPPIYAESLTFWASLVKRACQRLATSATEASCSDSPPLPMTVQLVWALILPTLGCFALHASIPYVLHMRSSSLCALYASSTFRASNCLAIAEGTLYRFFSSIPQLFAQAVKLLCMHTCVFVSSLGTRSCHVIDNHLTTLQHANEYESHLSQALLSRIAATTADLACQLQGLPPQGKRLVYTLLLLFSFGAFAFTHVACFDYPLPLAIPLAAGWSFALVFACYVNSQPPVDYPDQPAPNVRLPPAALPAPSESVALPVPAQPLAPSSPEDLLQSVPHSPVLSGPSSPTPSSSTSYASSSSSDEELEPDDWSFVPRRPRSRRSLVFTVRAPPLSPIAEVSSVASTASVSSLCSSPSSSPRLRSRSFSSRSEGESGSVTPSPPASPVVAVMMREAEVKAPGMGMGTGRDVRQVARARARSDMAEFRSFSLALERRTGEPRAGSGGGGGSELQSNGVVFGDWGAVLGEVELEGAPVARSKAEEARVCRDEYDSVYCTGECWNRNEALVSKVDSL